MENIEKCEYINKAELLKELEKLNQSGGLISFVLNMMLPTIQVVPTIKLSDNIDKISENEKECDCWVGWFEEVDHSEWFTEKDLIQYIEDGKEYAEYFTAFNYCPLCGKKIDWKAIKGGANG